MAGLSAAGELKRAGLRVVVLDKGRGVGGRIATRRIGGATFDHGAQFITAQDPRFAAVLEKGRHAGVVEEWGLGGAEHLDNERRWRGKPAMSAVAKHLSFGLDLQLETPVAALHRSGDRWRVETTTGRTFLAEAVVLTPPVPQSIALLDAGGLSLAPEVRTRLTAIQYERCLAIMALLDGPSRIPTGGFTPPDGPIAWIADNQLKGISAEPAVTIHATHAFSLEHWDRDRDETARTLLNAAAPWLGAGVTTFQVHGWRYSKPMRVDPAPCVLVNQSPRLVLAGDAFAGPHVEGAAISGWAAAEAILSPAD